MKVDFSKLQFLWIDKMPIDLWLDKLGNRITAYQLMGEKIYYWVKEIGTSRLWEKIYNGETVDITIEQLQALKDFLNLPQEQSGITNYAVRETLLFLNESK